jgi:hypothetical protein
MTESPKLSPEAKAAVPEIAAFLRAKADNNCRSKQVATGLHVAANVISEEAGVAWGIPPVDGVIDFGDSRRQVWAAVADAAGLEGIKAAVRADDPEMEVAELIERSVRAALNKAGVRWGDSPEGEAEMGEEGKA